MSIAESLRLLWIGGLVDCTGKRAWNTDKLFDRKRVTVTKVNSDEITLYVGNAGDAVRYYAHEADRFASAAFESLLSSKRNEDYPRSTGWLFIQSYYAAFFAVHALMRMHGWACTRLSTGNLKSLNDEISLLFPGGLKRSAGLYLVRNGSGGRELICKTLDSSIGGTHEILWSLLRGFLDEIVAVALSRPDGSGQALAASVDDFFRVVDSFGGPKWFSTIRNRLNYSHDYGAWYPYEKSTCDYERVYAVLGAWKEPPGQSLTKLANDELIRFAGACAFLVSLCGTTVKDLHHRSKPSSPFRQSSGRLV